MLRSALVAVVVFLTIGPAFASSASAPLVVSLTVVRSCAVQTGSDLTLRCSASVGQPRIGDVRAPEPTRAAPAAPVTASTAPWSDTRLVTINF